MSDKLHTNEDFVYLKRFDYSIKKALERYPDGVPEHLIAQALGLEKEDVDELYQEVIEKLREIMKVEK